MLADLDARLARCTLEDRDALRRRARRLRVRSDSTGGANGQEAMAPRWAQLDRAIRGSEALFEQRKRSVPDAQVPPHLPIAAAAPSIVRAIAEHSVIIVSGDTGSGKSTQLPKLCLQAGRGVAGQIAHTQPRRVAARGVARRVAQELHQAVGESVGFKVRFDSRVRRESHIKVLTDGLLLAELGRDRHLHAYDTVIVDEAHERSLNIDFLLGYLKRLCRTRPELRVVISSATLDESRFSAFFDDAPVLSIAGRSFPVEVRYREPQGDAPLAEQVRSAVAELGREGPGDVLVFLSGEREIHEVAGRLRHAFADAMDVLPLYARLPLARQDQIFAAHTRRRVVLATNVAETSLTVPGVRFVVDAGCARIGRYVPGSAVQHLPVERISKASARQRAGRCGREAPGICIRLYGEEEFERLVEFTEPEILRTDLAAVLLHTRALGVRDLRQFPLLDAPAQRHVNDGLRLLRELGAMTEGGDLSTLGRQLARLPLDPRVGRMLFAAAEHDCVAEVLIIAAGLAAGDPRERIGGQRGPAPQHLRFENERSDFLRLVSIWQYVHGNKRGHAGDSLAQLCRRARLSFARVQEWREVHLQLSIAAREMGLKPRAGNASYASIHRALLSGLLRHVGCRATEREYQGIRGNSFRISRDSAQSDRRVRWVLAAELVDAGGTFAHTVAGIRPEWVEEAAGALIRRTHFDAWWDARRVQPMVFEQTRLYALTVTARRAVRFAPISHTGAREVFIRGALIDGQYQTESPALHSAWRWIARRRELEAKLRRPDPAIGHDRLYEFFERAMPAQVCDAVTFEAWWPQASGAELERLTHVSAPMPGGDVLENDDHEELARLFPDVICLPDATVPLTYAFAPGEDNDGITVTVPRALLGGVRETHVERAVPGLLRDCALLMLKLLPKSMRRRVGPAGEAVDGFLRSTVRENDTLARSLAYFLSTQYEVEVDARYWDGPQVRERIPLHLRVRYRVLDEAGALLACDRDLQRMQLRFVRGDSASGPANGAAVFHKRWAFAAIPVREQVQHDGASGWVYPALVASDQGVSLAQFDSEARARAEHARGLLRLAIAAGALDIPRLMKTVPHADILCLLNALVTNADGTAMPDPAAWPADAKVRTPCEQLLHDLVLVALQQAFGVDGIAGADGDGNFEQSWRVRTREQFASYLRTGLARVGECIETESAAVLEVLQLYREVVNLLNERWPDAYAASLDDVRTQIDAMTAHGFVRTTATGHRRDLPRYLSGARLRLHKLRRGGARDAHKLAQLRPVTERWLARARAHASRGRRDRALEEYRWLVEEYRISLFAQELGTAQKVSRERLDRLWALIPP